MPHSSAASTSLPARKTRWPDGLHVLLYLTAITLLSTWLPLIRGLFDGASYSWGNSYFDHLFSGYGAGGDYWLNILKAVLALLLFYAAFHAQKRTWFYISLFAWYVPMISSNLYEMIRHPDDYVLEGDTLHMKFSLLIPFALFLLFIVALIIQVLRKEPRTIVHTVGVNRKWLLLLACMLPVQFVVLRLGKEDLLDVAGVILTVIQCLLLPRIFITGSKNSK